MTTGATTTSSSTLSGVCGLRTLPRTGGRTGASSTIGKGSTALVASTTGAAVIGASSSTKIEASVGRVRAVLAGLVGRAFVVRLVGAGVVDVVVVVVVVTCRQQICYNSENQNANGVIGFTSGTTSSICSSTNSSSLNNPSDKVVVVEEALLFLLFRRLLIDALRSNRAELRLDGNSVGSSSTAGTAGADVVVEVDAVDADD